MSEQTTILADGTERVVLEITSVRYDRLVNLGNYENRKLGVSVQVPEGADPARVVAAAQEWVESRLLGERAQRDEAEGLEQRLSSLRYKANDIEGKVRALEGIWKQAAAMLTAHGITPETTPALQWHWPKLPDESVEAQARRVEDGDDDDDREDDEGPGARY